MRAAIQKREINELIRQKEQEDHENKQKEALLEELLENNPGEAVAKMVELAEMHIKVINEDMSKEDREKQELKATNILKRYSDAKMRTHKGKFPMLMRQLNKEASKKAAC